ncbi:MAG: type II toxin-antitoxin system RelE/ParE family toxin [Terracidiphilus sp.]|jgi:phage-related protein
MPEGPQPRRIPLIFYRTGVGAEPARDWLKALPEVERREIGKDLMRAQWRWPVGMPLCKPLSNGLWEIRTQVPTGRIARILVCFYLGHLVALHGFIKKTRKTPDEDLRVARGRRKELER